MPYNDYLEYKELYHYGVKGQKWGIRRYQNEDGTLNKKGIKKYNTSTGKNIGFGVLRDIGITIVASAISGTLYSKFNKGKLTKKGYIRAQKILFGIGAAASVGNIGYTIGKSISDSKFRNKVNEQMLKDKKIGN